jgi:hypothetical protein
MASQILRPTAEGEWLIQGPWGRRRYDPMSRVTFYGQVHRELITSGVLPLDSPPPSNRYHDHVTIKT